MNQALRYLRFLGPCEVTARARARTPRALAVMRGIVVAMAGAGTACSTPAPTVPDANGAVTAAPGQIAIAIERARQRREGRDNYDDLLMAVNIANGEGGRAVPLNDSYFTLRLRSGLVIRTTPLYGDRHRIVAGLQPAATTQLAAGHQYGPWLIAFDIDAEKDAPIELRFEVPGVAVGDSTVGDGRSAVASVTVEACTSCTRTGTGSGSATTFCTYLDRDLNACGSCDPMPVTPHDDEPVACENGAYVCSSAERAFCPVDGCVDLSYNPRHCGACNNKIPDQPGAHCRGGQLVCEDGTTKSGNQCYALQSDPNHCGQVGRQCATIDSSIGTWRCQDAICIAKISQRFWGDRCDQLCAAHGLVCRSGYQVGLTQTFPAACNETLNAEYAGCYCAER